VNAEQQVWMMQKLPRKVAGRIFFVSHRQARNYRGSRGVIALFSIGTTQQLENEGTSNEHGLLVNFSI
jgi:hypothetical protein